MIKNIIKKQKIKKAIKKEMKMLNEQRNEALNNLKIISQNI